MTARLQAWLLLALWAPALRADLLDELRARLASPAPAAAVRARIEVATETVSPQRASSRRGPTLAAVVAESGPAGVRLEWSAEQVEGARSAERHRRSDPEAPPPQTALGGITAWEAVSLLEAAPGLLNELEGATLIEARDDVRDGRPRLRLSLAPRRRADPDLDSAIKQHEDTLLLWLDDEGWPMAMERTVRIRGSKFLVRFAGETHLTASYQRLANRLVVALQVEESVSEAMGKRDEEIRRTTVTLVP